MPHALTPAQEEAIEAPVMSAQAKADLRALIHGFPNVSDLLDRLERHGFVDAV